MNRIFSPFMFGLAKLGSNRELNGTSYTSFFCLFCMNKKPDTIKHPAEINPAAWTGISPDNK